MENKKPHLNQKSHLMTGFKGTPILEQFTYGEVYEAVSKIDIVIFNSCRSALTLKQYNKIIYTLLRLV